jgi:hypothetical protein
MQRKPRPFTSGRVAARFDPVKTRVSMERRLYEYVGPSAILLAARNAPRGTNMRAPADILAYVRTPSDDPMHTFIVDRLGILSLAPRRSEHVACAGGEQVQSAGEIAFAIHSGSIEVDFVSNLSTGYCPEPESWGAVSDALHQLGIVPPSAFTHEVIFRKCPSCGERNVVKESDWRCAVCDAPLPDVWNFAR